MRLYDTLGAGHFGGPVRRHPGTGEPVSVTETSAYDAATQVNHIQWHWRFVGGRETVSDLPMRVYFP